MTIRERMKQLIAAETHDRTRYIQLREVTGISGDIWKNFWFDRRAPDAGMLEALARAWPKYAYWLVTGSTDVLNGHQCPKDALCFEPVTTSLLTAEAVLRNGVDAAIAFDIATKGEGEIRERSVEYISEALAGQAFHVVPHEGVGLWPAVDAFIKKVRALREAISVRNKELEMRSRS